MTKHFLFIAFIVMAGCRPTPFKVQTIAPKEPHTVNAPSQDAMKELDVMLKEGIAARYKKAGSPSFGLINGFYRLPVVKPFGAATVVRGFSYNTYFEAAEITDQERGYAIEPITGDNAMALNNAVNVLLDNGVKIKDISMTDAINIANAESKAATSGKVFSLSKTLAPDVDYLISVYPSTSVRGPVFIGRVIKKDGTLLAFRVIHRDANSYVLSGLIVSLFEDTVNRI